MTDEELAIMFKTKYRNLHDHLVNHSSDLGSKTVNLVWTKPFVNRYGRFGTGESAVANSRVWGRAVKDIVTIASEVLNESGY